MSVEAIFFAAIEATQVADRRDWLDRACGDDLRQREFLEWLLEAHESVFSSPSCEPASDSGEAARDPLQSASSIPHGLLTPSRYSASLGRLGRYEVVQVMAVGGMSVVLEAFDAYLSRIVAVKLLAPDLCRLSRSRQRFQREAQVAAAIDHVHVAKIFAVEQQNDVPYLVMEFVRGRTLSARLRVAGRAPVDEILRIGAQVAQGLAAIHEKGLVHRDIKPDNILLEFPHEVVKITDFGVARSIDEHGLTRTGEMNGTPQFMSPEQAQGLAVDQRSDLFSFGVLLYAMATGSSPFEAQTPLAAMRRVCDETPEPLGDLRSDVPPWLAEVISNLLEKEPAHRLLSARDLAELFTSYGAHNRAKRHPSGVRSRRIGRLTKLASMATACLAALALGLLIWIGSATDDSTPLLQRLKYLWWGYPRITVEVDDPTVDIAIDGERTSLRKVGSFQSWLRPGVYLLRAFKGGEAISAQHVSFNAWEQKVIRVGPSEPPVLIDGDSLAQESAE